MARVTLALGPARAVHQGLQLRPQMTAQLLVGRAAGRARSQLELDASDARYLPPALALLPPGVAFEAPEGSVLRSVVAALSRSQSRVGRQLGAIERQLLPGEVGELLADWERLAGLTGREEAADQAEAQAAYDRVIADGGLATPPISLDERRALAALDVLCRWPRFSLEELARRVKGTTICHAAEQGTGGAWRVVEYQLAGIEVRQYGPFRTGESRTGEQLGGTAWLGRYEIVIVSPVDPQPPLGSHVLLRCQMLLEWIRRTWPPHCALVLSVRLASASNSYRLLTLNCTD